MKPKPLCKGCGNAPADPGYDGLCKPCHKAMYSKEMVEMFNFMSLTDYERIKAKAGKSHETH